MFCQKCGKPVEDNDTFCGYCGEPLTAGAASAKNNGAASDVTPPPQMDSRAEYAMLRPPEAEMRPLTKVAYNIHDSEQEAVVSGSLNVIFVGLCLGMVANLLAIFEKMSKLSQTLRTSGETYLSQTIYKDVGGDNTMGLMWLCLLLAALVLLFIMVGKLKLRLKKIRRKEKKFKAKGIFLDLK